MPGHEQAGQQAGVQAAGAQHDEVRGADGLDRVGARLHRLAGLIQTRRMPRERMIRDWPFSCRAVDQLRVERQRLGRDRHHLAAHREDPVGQPDALLEVARDVRERRDEQVAERVATDARRRSRRSVGNRYWSRRVMVGSASASAAMQLRMSPTGAMPSSCAELARRAAVVGDRDDRGDVAGVLLEAAQQGRQAGAAADGHDARAARERALLVHQLDERLGAGGERLQQHAHQPPQAVAGRCRRPPRGPPARAQPVRAGTGGWRG